MYPQRILATGFMPAYQFTGTSTLFPADPVNRRGMFTVFPKTTAVPNGYSAGGAFVMPYVAGGMAGRMSFDLTGAGNVLAGGPMTGAGTLDLDGAGALSLVISMSGDGTLTVTGAGGLALTIGLSGNGALEIIGAGGLSMIVPIAGAGDMTLTGAGDLRGKLALSGDMTATDVVTPQTVAAAVWAAIAGESNVAGSMGEKLNDAGSASNPWTEVIEAGLTAAELLRLLTAAMAGKVSGAGSGTITFRDLADSKARIVATVDSDGNRTAVTRDAT